METISILFILCFFGVFAVLIYISFKIEKKRTKALKAFAESNGFSFTERPLLSIADFNLGKAGYSKRLFNLIERRESGRLIRVFDYRYTIGGGRSSRTITQTVYMAELPKPFPNFLLRKEGFLDRIADVIGFKDIDFPDFPKFSKEYHLKGQDEHSIRKVFTPAIIRYFEQNPLQGEIEVKGNWLMYYLANKRDSPEELPKKLDLFRTIVSIFSDF